MYLAATIDLYSRSMVGLAMDDSTIAGELTRRSLMPSILRRNFGEGLIGHSDEEQSQYAAHDYIAILAELWEYEPI